MKIQHKLKSISTSATLLFVFAMILTIPMLNTALAAKPSAGYKSSANCSWSETKWNVRTCCWRESNGVSLGESYCQSCTMGGKGMGIILTCDEPELQIRYGPDWGLGIDYGDNGGVLGKADDSDQPEDNQAPLEDEKVADDNPQQEEQNDNQGQDSGCKVGRWGIC